MKQAENALLGALLGAIVGLVGKFGLPVAGWWPVWLCGLAGALVGLAIGLIMRR